MFRQMTIAGIAAAFMTVAGLAAQAESVEDTWNLADIFPSTDAWEAEKAELEPRVAALSDCKGNLGDSAKVLAGCMNQTYDTLKDLASWFVYASMGSDADTRNEEWQARRQVAQQLFAKYTQATAYQAPELIAVGEKKLNKYANKKAMADYRFFIENTLRQGEHTLGDEGESVIAAASLVTTGPFNVYRTFSNAEMPWSTVTLSDGTEVRLDQSAYGRYRGSSNRDDRKLVFDTFWNTWSDFDGTLGTNLSSMVNVNTFTADVRSYESSLASAISGPNIPDDVYRALLTSVNENLGTLHRYFQLRGRMLGIDDLRYYDIYPDLVELDKDFSLEVGKELTLAAVAPLGEEYVSAIRKGFDERWMDAYPREGKRSGAYMNGFAFDAHPYVLMNYTDDYSSVSTLAHEWGHAMHSYLAARAQPFSTYGYATFTAEIASTFNEALLLEHMLSIAENDQERLYYLGNALESLRGTFFRQAMFAEFELAIHEAAEAGQPLTGATFTKIYGDLLRKYHGHDQGIMTIDDLYTVEWAYIPHFYLNFYVYQYATSIAAGSLLATDVIAGKKGARDQYLGLLKAGGSDYPYELLKRAGVDMATAAPYEATIARMNSIMDEIEALLDRQGD